MKRLLILLAIFAHSDALATNPIIEFTEDQDVLQIRWTGSGTLQQSEDLQHWSLIPNATSPFSIETTAPIGRYFRLVVVADRVIRNARIHTVDDALPTATTLAIHGGRIIYVGTELPAVAMGPNTEIIDARGRLVLPGFQDAHLHVVEAGVNEATAVLPQFGTRSQYRVALQKALTSQPGDSSVWVTGAGVNMAALLETVTSPLALIDEIIPDRPAIILDDIGHGVWANSLALAAVGFDRRMSNPPGGIIDVDEQGDLTGIVLESASQNLIDASQIPTTARLNSVYQAFLGTLALLAQNGITSVSDAGGYLPRGHPSIWARAEGEGTLTVRASNALYVYPERPFAQQVADITALFSNDPAKLARFNQVKLYVDGIITQATAALLQPYQPNVDLIAGNATGFTYFDTATLNNYATTFEAAGFQLHFHATGDRGARLALDAIAHAKATNHVTDRRHRITHLYLVDPADRPRFAQMGVFADFQLAPSSLAQDAIDEATSFIGSRMSGYLPAGSILAAGADLTLSSDFDADELSPFIKIETVVTRGNEGIPDVATAIRLMTLSPARLLHHEERTGSLTVGKFADIILLDQDILTIPVTKISETKVLLTLLSGKTVFRESGF